MLNRKHYQHYAAECLRLRTCLSLREIENAINKVSLLKKWNNLCKCYHCSVVWCLCWY